MEAENPVTEFDLKRFERHFRLPGFGTENQQRIKKSAVIIVGMGGLGNIVGQQLAAAGIGRMTLVDFDTIEISNLSRQLLFSESDLGQHKATVAAHRLAHQFPGTDIKEVIQAFDSKSGMALCEGHDLIIDCCDVRTAKYSIDRIASSMGIPVVFGALSRFDGQVSVFHGRSSTSYMQVFPTEPDSKDEGCDGFGVWAPAVGIIGSIMAQECLNMLAFGTTQLDGRLLHVDLKRYQFSQFEIVPAPSSKPLTLSGLPSSIHPIRENEVQGVKSSERELLCIRIVEQNESVSSDFDLYLALHDILWRSEEWEKDRPILLQCHAGKRSLEAALLLSGQGFSNIYAVFPNT